MIQEEPARRNSHTATPVRPDRDYTRLLKAGETPDVLASGTALEVMQRVVDRLWDQFGGSGPGRGYSWVGFYTLDRENPDQLILGPRRDKPACSPIGLHGACGRCLLARRGLVVTDVARLGTGYIACDPRDRSEVVVPLLYPDGSAWGVLDVDSHEVGAFDTADAVCLMRLLRYTGLSTHTNEHAGQVEFV